MKRFLILGLFFLMASCTGQKPCGPCRLTISLSCGIDEAIKSSFPETVTSIGSVNAFIYNGGKLVYSSYNGDGATLTVIFPDENAEYDLYFIANSGELDAPAKENDVSAIVCSSINSLDLSVYGLPMSGKALRYRPGNETRFIVTPLCARIDLNFEDSAGSADYSIESVRLRGVASEVFPFAESGRTYAVGVDGDYLSESDIEKLNNGETVSLYAVENLQGVLLPFNSDPKKKIPSSLASLDIAERCTYVEITARVNTTALAFESVCYRAYLGEDLTSDFNIVRGRKYRFKINFESNMVSEEEWRIDPSDPLVVGDIVLSKTNVSVMSGIDDTISVKPVSANSASLLFDVSIDEQAKKASGLTFRKKNIFKDGKPTTFLIFSTSLPIDGLGRIDAEPSGISVPVTISSREKYNDSPAISKTIEAKVYHEVFPICLKTRRIAGENMLFAYSNNPMGISFSGKLKVRRGQEVDGVETSFGPVVPNRSGVLIGSVPLYEDGTAVFLEMAPFIAGRQVDMYMGDLSKAFFGPGYDHAPGNMARYDENEEYHMEDYSPANHDGRDYLAHMTTSKGYLFKLDDKTTGWNCYDKYDFNSFTGKPFYFANGGLQIILFAKYDDSPAYLDDSGRVGYEVYAFVPGRDLDLPSGFDLTGRCIFGTKLGVMKQFWGNVHSWLEWRTFEYKIYLNINGCSCWAGASKGQSGCNFVEF